MAVVSGDRPSYITSVIRETLEKKDKDFLYDQKHSQLRFQLMRGVSEGRLNDVKDVLNNQEFKLMEHNIENGFWHALEVAASSEDNFLIFKSNG